MSQAPAIEAAENAELAAQNAEAARAAAEAAAVQAAVARADARAGARAGAQAQADVPAGPAPRTGAELAGLRARRDIVSRQLERTSERRGELARDLANTDPNEGTSRRGIEQRLEVLDDQVVQLERTLVATDRQIAAAPPELLAQYAQSEQQPRVVHTGPDDEDLVGMGFGGFFLGLLVMVIGRRIRAWRRRGERGATTREHAGPDPRIERLTQAVDAIAVEVERIGEGQRFVTQLLAEARPQLAEYGAADHAAPTRPVPNAGR